MSQKAAKRRRWPRLPHTTESAAGQIDIHIVKTPGDDENVMGMFDPVNRVIYIKKSLRGDQKWLTLYHELSHAALWDSGAHNLLPGDLEENICDAIATNRFRERFS